MSSFAAPRPAAGFAVPRSTLQGRADVNHARLTPPVEDFLRRSRHPTRALAELVSLVQYGDSSRAVEEQTGTPVLRMGNLQDGDWDLTDLKYTTLTAGEQAGYLLAPGDVLVNRTNSKELVGKCAVFAQQGPWMFASYLIRVRVSDNRELRPEFLARFLNSAAGRLQIDRVSRQIIGMANINAQEIRGLRIPLPPAAEQDRQIKQLAQQARVRARELAQAHRLLTSADREIARRLKLKLTAPAPRVAYAASRGALRAGGRIHPEFFHPERVASIRAIQASSTPAGPLDGAVDFVRELTAPADGENYIGLANVERDTGELVDRGPEELPTGACLRFRAGDILYGRLRPYLNKVHLAGRDGIASPEFFVLRPRTTDVKAEYVAAILRSELVLAQTRHLTAGNTHPRLTPKDVHSMVIPLPSAKLQRDVAALDRASRERARTQKQRVTAAWDAAKQRFGDELVTPPRRGGRGGR